MKKEKEMIERTYVMIKPDGLRKKIQGKVLERIFKKDLMYTAYSTTMLTKEQVQTLYSDKLDEPYYQELENYMLSGQVIEIVVEGNDAVATVRELIGDTDCCKATPGTIRGDFGTKDKNSKMYNLIHASDSIENAEKEISYFFPNLKTNDQVSKNTYIKKK